MLVTAGNLYTLTGDSYIFRLGNGVPDLYLIAIRSVPNAAKARKRNAAKVSVFGDFFDVGEKPLELQARTRERTRISIAIEESIVFTYCRETAVADLPGSTEESL